MPNLADNHMREKFVRKLEKCECAHGLTDWECRFVSDLRERFDEREVAFDLGITPWNPSANQWNILSEIAEKKG